MEKGKGRYSGLRIGCITRNSTPRQEGNYSTEAQDQEFQEFVRYQDGHVVPFPENTVSGRDLSQREHARRLLDLIKTRDLDGIGGYTVDRLTRDETMLDCGVIIRACTDVRAIIATFDRDYRVWLAGDLKDFKKACADSGDQMMSTRDTFARGLFMKAQKEPFFMGMLGLGYTTEPKQVRTEGKHPRNVWRNIPCRDEGQRPLMEALGEALDVCQSPGEVTARMARLGYYPLGKRGAVKGKPVRWIVANLREFLKRDVIFGVWEYGRTSKRKSGIWDAPTPTGTRRDRRWTLECPELKWYERPRVEAWRKKFLPADGASKPRKPKHPHHVRGVLRCASCGRPMIGAGVGLYSCPSASGTKATRVCPCPTFVSEAVALRELRKLLPAALRARQDLRDRLRARLHATDEIADLRSQCDTLAAQLEEAGRRFFSSDVKGQALEILTRVVDEKQAELSALRAQLDQLETAGQTDEREERLLEMLLNGRLDRFDKQPPEERGQVYRATFADVVIVATGRGAGRKFDVRPDWTNLLVTRVGVTTSCNPLAKLGTLCGC